MFESIIKRSAGHSLVVRSVNAKQKKGPGVSGAHPSRWLCFTTSYLRKCSYPNILSEVVRLKPPIHQKSRATNGKIRL